MTVLDSVNIFLLEWQFPFITCTYVYLNISPKGDFATLWISIIQFLQVNTQYE